MICPGVYLFASIMFVSLCTYWTCMSISFTKLGKFSFFLFFSNRFPISCSSSSPSSTPMRGMLDLLKLSQRLLTLLGFFFGFFFLLVVLIDYFLIPYVPNHWFDSQLHPLYCCFPVNCSLFELVCSSVLFFRLLSSSLSSLRILITSVFNSASDRFFISIQFSSFSGVLIYSFIWAMFLCLHFGSPPCICFCVLGRAAMTPSLGSMA